jgi:hypothetical protein
MRSTVTRILLTTYACGLILGLANATPAQRRGPRGREYTRDEVNALIKRAEDRSDVFVKLFDRALDKSALDGTRKEDRLNERAKELEKTMNKLRHEFDRKESYIATKPEMTRVLNNAGEINRVMLNRNLRGDAEQAWFELRRELNVLASVYYLPELRTR